MSRIAKLLSANDVGATGGHQAGILVPKSRAILSFFPRLDPNEKNPRQTIVVRDKERAKRWEFNFIYYNNRLFGGTRNEYRLTGMTAFLRSVMAREGDSLVFEKDDDSSIWMSLERAGQLTFSADGALRIGSAWTVIKL